MYISEWDLHGAATTTSSLSHKGEIYTQGHGIPPCISEWDLHGAALSYYQQLVPQGRNIHPGHGIPPCIYQNGIYTVHGYYYQQLVPQGEIYTQGHGSHVYIRMGSTRCSAATTTSSFAQGEIYTRDMAFLHVYIRMGSHGARCDYYQQLVPQGEIYTQGHGIPPCISEWDLHGAAATTTSSLCHKGEYTPRDMAFLHVYIRMGSTRCSTATTSIVPQGRNIHPGTWHSSMYISEWDLHGAAISYYQQLSAAREKYTPRDMAFLHVYQNGIIGAATSYYQQLVPQGRNIHPGTWHSMYISMGSTRCSAATTSSLCHKGEIYTQGHGIPPCIYQNGITRRRDYQQLVPQGIHGTWHSSMYISEWDLHGSAATTTSSLCQGEIYTQDMASPPYISEWDLTVPPNFITSSHATRRNTIQGHGIPPCIYQNGI
jgi:hypothetical protein